MAVYKDKWNGYKGNTWRVACYYKDWKGERKKHDKRGFHTKREALAYEREFLAKTSKDINMGFDTFVDIYLGDLKPRIKPTTLETKESIINTLYRNIESSLQKCGLRCGYSKALKAPVRV